MRHTYGAALLAGALATPAAHAQDTRALVHYVDSVATAAVAEHRTAGVSVAVVKNGRTVLAKGYGFADLENDVPATAETVYRIGSITKQFTSAAIMRLDGAGQALARRHAAEVPAELPGAGKPRHGAAPAQPHVRNQELHEPRAQVGARRTPRPRA